jgi:2-polyprenyl-3-methyl-5-hydroxy-6-metoxy-1,4-benzoquinol methylase
MLDTNKLACPRLLEFLYLTADRVRSELHVLQDNFTAAQQNPAAQNGTEHVVHAVSKGSSLISAHFHIAGALTIQRKECITEHVRMLFVVLLRRTRPLLDLQVRQLWHIYETSDVESVAEKWLKEAVEVFDTDVQTFQNVLKDWTQPPAAEAQYFSHEADGRFSTLELLRRDTFEEWMMDKGLLRALLRFLFKMDATIADVGAGSGHYAKWLNETGLVTAQAFDGTMDIEHVTQGKVTPLNLAERLAPGAPTFDHVMCLEVAEHIPAEGTATFIANLAQLARETVVLSWSPPLQAGVGHVNGRTEAEVLDLFKQHAPTLQVDAAMTQQLRPLAHLPYIARTLLVLRKAEAKAEL